MLSSTAGAAAFEHLLLRRLTIPDLAADDGHKLSSVVINQLQQQQHPAAAAPVVIASVDPAWIS